MDSWRERESHAVWSWGCERNEHREETRKEEVRWKKTVLLLTLLWRIE